MENSLVEKTVVEKAYQKVDLLVSWWVDLMVALLGSKMAVSMAFELAPSWVDY